MKIRSLFTAVAFAAASAAAHAEFLYDQELTFTHIYNQGSYSDDEEVGPEVEFTSEYFDVDATDDTLRITFNETSTYLPNSLGFNGFVLEDHESEVQSFSTATITSLTTFAGFNASRMTVTPDFFYADFAGLTIPEGSVIEIQLSPVPELSPAAFLLIGGPLLALVRRRTRAAA